jgi:NADH-quinone oxidoreductase subunit J
MNGVTLPEAITFFACAIIVLGGAFGVIWSRNPVQAALSLVATLFGVAVLFLNLDAPFLAAVQVIVYTGAIVVLILFVMMLLGVDREEDIDEEPLPGQRVIAFAIAAGVAGLVVAGVLAAGPDLLAGEPAATAAITDDTSNIAQIGRLLFTDYVFAVEITAVLLTIAVVAAVVLSRRSGDLEPMPGRASMEPPEADVPEQEEVFD